MELTAVSRKELAFVQDAETCLILPICEKETFPEPSALLAGHVTVFEALLAKGSVTGKTQSCFYLPTPGAAYQGVLAIGLGKRDALNRETVRRAAGRAAAGLTKHKVTHIYLETDDLPDYFVECFVEGLVLAQYAFDVYKKPGKEEEDSKPVAVHNVVVIAGDGKKADQAARRAHLAALIATGVNGARQLANTPSNDMTPTALAEFALGVAKVSKYCHCSVLDHHHMEALGMQALLGVARGSAEPPKLIMVEYKHPKAKRTVAMVGKGVCFDSGGISIKPAQGMHEMKYDMCGAAAVLCAMMTVAQLQPKLHVIAMVPAVENKTGARAQTPGDIVRAYNGKTIEVHNTDAEGRLILADAMAYVVDQYKPEMIVDLATLTGACVVALGHYAAGILGNNDALIDALIEAGEETGDRLWKLPLWTDYEKLIEGEHADLCNIGPGRDAGAITGAAFIKHFVGDTPWAHLDIAGVAYGVKHVPHLSSKSATGFGVRLLTRWLIDLADK